MITALVIIGILTTSATLATAYIRVDKPERIGYPEPYEHL